MAYCGRHEWPREIHSPPQEAPVNRRLWIALWACIATVPAGAGTTPQPRSGGQVVIGIQQEPDILNPALTSMISSEDVLAVLNATPLDVDDHGKLIPILAEEVPTVGNGGISRDGKTVRLRFRRNAKWHDGQPVTSTDLKFTWKAIMDPHSQSPQVPGWDKIASIDDSDPHVAVIHLKLPYAPILVQFTQGQGTMLPAHVLAHSSDFARDPFNHTPTVLCGPYKFEKWESGGAIYAVRNPDWVFGPPRLDRVIFKIIPSENTLFTQLQTGEIDVWSRIQNIHQLDAIANVPGITLSDRPTTLVEFLSFNLSRPALADHRVRQAIAEAIDTEELSRSVYLGKYPPAKSILSTLSWAYPTDIKVYRHDPAHAALLLDEAGWKREGEVRVKETNGKKETLHLTLVTTSGRPLRQRVQSVLQQRLKAVGIEVETLEVPANLLLDARDGRMVKGDFDVALYANNFAYDPSEMETSFLTEYAPPAGGNVTRYHNADVDRWMHEAARVSDRERRAALYRKVQRQLIEDLPALPLLQWHAFTAYRSQLENVRPHFCRADYWNIATWWWNR